MSAAAVARGAGSAAARLAGRLRGAARDLAAFALPQQCPGCGADAAAARLLCDACRAAIPIVSALVCARCLARGGSGAPCGSHPGFAVRPAWMYDGRAAAFVAELKFGDRPGLARAAADALATAARAFPRPDLVAPVPLHPARRRERGYNQAAALARGLAAAIGAPCLEDAIARVRPTAPQSRRGARARRANVAGAFAVVAPWAVADRRVLLVDDVMTSGATLDACLATLDDAGAHAAAVTLAWAC